MYTDWHYPAATPAGNCSTAFGAPVPLDKLYIEILISNVSIIPTPAKELDDHFTKIFLPNLCINPAPAKKLDELYVEVFLPNVYYSCTH